MSTTNQSVGAAWKKTVNTKSGQVEILSLTIGDKRYSLWPNQYKKEGERSPDYRLVEDNYKPNVNSVDAKQAAFDKQRLKSLQNQDLPF